ncbi:MAG: hypothetical protein ACRDHZ_25660, partial [Ktedonobacteraceae bacterium]
NTTAHDIDSRIAVHGQTTITTTKEANGNTVQTASGNGFHMGETAEVSVDSHGGNGQENSQQGAGSLYKTTMGQGGGTSPAAQAVPTQPTDTTQQVVVEQVKGEGVNVAGHSVIGVNGATPVGLVPNSDKAAAEALGKEIVTTFLGTPEASPVTGHVEPLAKGRIVVATAIFRVPSKQAGRIQAMIIRMTDSPQIYDPIYRNCDAFVEEVLRYGGVKTPNDISPRGLVADLRKQFPQ